MVGCRRRICVDRYRGVEISKLLSALQRELTPAGGGSAVGSSFAILGSVVLCPPKQHVEQSVSFDAYILNNLQALEPNWRGHWPLKMGLGGSCIARSHF